MKLLEKNSLKMNIYTQDDFNINNICLMICDKFDFQYENNGDQIYFYEEDEYSGMQEIIFSFKIKNNFCYNYKSDYVKMNVENSEYINYLLDIYNYLLIKYL